MPFPAASRACWAASAVPLPLAYPLCPTHPRQPADCHRHPGARRFSHTTTAPGMGAPGRRATPGGNGRKSALLGSRMVRAILPKLLNQGCRWCISRGNDPGNQPAAAPPLAERRFSDDIPGLLQHADLAISRAGAGSLSELAVCGTPSACLPPGRRSPSGCQCRLCSVIWGSRDRASTRS